MQRSTIKNLKGRLERDSLIDKYDSVFKEYGRDQITERVPDCEV